MGLSRVEIVWTGNELALNPQFNLEASLRGSDRRRDDRIPANLFDPEGLLDNPISPDGMNPKSFRLTFNVPSNVLDEDDSIFVRIQGSWKSDEGGRLRLLLARSRV